MWHENRMCINRLTDSRMREQRPYRFWSELNLKIMNGPEPVGSLNCEKLLDQNYGFHDT